MKTSKQKQHHHHDAPPLSLEDLIALVERKTSKASLGLKSTPLLPTTSMRNKLIFSIPNFLTSAECQALIQFAEREGFTHVAHAATKDIAFRDNFRLQIFSPPLARAFWERICSLVPPQIKGLEASGLNPNLRFYKYALGQRFGPHVDESVLLEESGEISLFTVLVYLNDEGLVGGETIFYSNRKEVLRVRPLRGMALCHGHGEDCLLHEGAKVLSPQVPKYLLRTDVLYRTK